jgi:hypothetical protein
MRIQNTNLLIWILDALSRELDTVLPTGDNSYFILNCAYFSVQ